MNDDFKLSDWVATKGGDLLFRRILTGENVPYVYYQLSKRGDMKTIVIRRDEYAELRMMSSFSPPMFGGNVRAMGTMARIHNESRPNSMYEVVTLTKDSDNHNCFRKYIENVDLTEAWKKVGQNVNTVGQIDNNTFSTKINEELAFREEELCRILGV